MNTMNQHIDMELLFDYQQGLLAPEVAKRITDHLKDCNELTSIAEGIKTWIQEHPTKSFDEFESSLNNSADRVKEQFLSKHPGINGRNPVRLKNRP